MPGILYLMEKLSDLPQHQGCMPQKTAVDREGQVYRYTQAFDPGEVGEKTQRMHWRVVGVVNAGEAVLLNTDGPCPNELIHPRTLLHSANMPSAQKEALKRVFKAWESQTVDRGCVRGKTPGASFASPAP